MLYLRYRITNGFVETNEGDYPLQRRCPSHCLTYLLGLRLLSLVVPRRGGERSPDEDRLLDAILLNTWGIPY